MFENKILLTSLPRSGSTWALKMLSIQKDVLGVFEPDHLDDAGIGENGMHPYINQNNAPDSYHKMYDDIFSGHLYPNASRKNGILEGGIRTLKSHSKKLSSLYPRKKNLIIKSVYSLHNTEWIYQNFSPKVVVMLRHPCSVIQSIHRKWPDARLKEPHRQPEFVKDYLEPYMDTLTKADTAYEQMASRVAAYYSAVLEASKRNPSWIVITHEQLCLDPVGEFKKLYEKLGLEWNQKVEDQINATNQPKTSDKIQHVSRIASEEIDKWKSLLTPQEIHEVENYYCPFDLPYYSENFKAA